MIFKRSASFKYTGRRDLGQFKQNPLIAAMTKICIFMFCKHAEIMNRFIAARAFRVPRFL